MASISLPNFIQLHNYPKYSASLSPCFVSVPFGHRFDHLCFAAAEPEDSKTSTGSEDEDKQERWVDWEDRILEDTVPLVGFVRILLHSGKYKIGDRLSPEHERTILERLLPYHPTWEKKVGSGVNYITIGYHPIFEKSRCLFIVRKDGEFVDFSFWKCIKGLIRKKYPLYADTFILTHFRRRRQ